MKSTLAAMLLIPALLALPTGAPAQGKSSRPQATAAPAEETDAASFARFESELKSALQSADPAAMALLTRFPLRVNGDGGSLRELLNASALQQEFDQAFPEWFRKEVLAAPSSNVERSDMVGIANGLIWAERVSTDNGMRYRLRTINTGRSTRTGAAQPQLVYACQTPKHRILVDSSNDEAFRYRSWNIPGFPPQKPDLEMSGSVDFEGRGECAHRVFTFERGDTRIIVTEPGCGESDTPVGSLEVQIKGATAANYSCE